MSFYVLMILAVRGEKWERINEEYPNEILLETMSNQYSPLESDSFMHPFLLLKIFEKQLIIAMTCDEVATGMIKYFNISV